MKFIVENLTIPQRLDLYLMTINPALTRSSAKKLVMNKRVLVNDRANLPNFKVRNNDVIEILNIQSNDNKEASEGLNKSKNTKDLNNRSNIFNLEEEGNFDKEIKTIKRVKMPLRIVYEDSDLIVVDKKAGVVVHPVYKHMEDTLVNGLAHYFYNKKENIKFRAVHRLDKETSGVIIFSKNLEAHDFLSSQFEKREVSKTYYAVVIGDFNEYLRKKHKSDSIELISYIKRNGDELKKKYVSTNDQKGDISVTKVTFERYWSYERMNKIYKGVRFSLLKVEPKTGRTHQIRVHLSEAGFPILGDIIYSDSKFKRMMLHANSIKIKLRDNTVKTFKTDLPKEFS